MGNEVLGFVPKTTTKAGPQSGLRLLMNVAQPEYCGVDTQPYGAGFRFVAYNPSSRLPSLLLTPSVSLSPGFDYNIVMQPVTHNRKTEFLGRCISSFIIPFDRDSVYNRLKCFDFCLTELVWKKCQCIGMWLDLTTELAAYFGKNISEVESCWGKNFDLGRLSCLREQAYIYFYNDPNVLCPNCKIPCTETLYSSQISASKLNLRQVKEILAADKISDGYDTSSSLENNLLHVNFYFNEMMEIIVTEDKKFTGDDLFTYIGGNLGLFLGMSTLTLFEIIFQAVFSIHIAVFSKHEAKTKWKRFLKQKKGDRNKRQIMRI